MKEFTVLICSMIIHLLSSKGIALGLVLLLFWLKGRQLGFQPEEWEKYFLGLSQKKVLRIALGISGVSISAASFLSYIFLQKTGFHHAFIIAGLMFAGSIFWFWHRWKGEKGKAYLLKRFSEIPQTILENRSKGIRG